jgi:serine O-acetyltransferase
MKTTLKNEELLNFTLNQIENTFPDGKKYDKSSLLKSFEKSLKRVEFCFSKINNKYFCIGEEVFFNHLNGDQYSMYLYFFSNTLFNDKFDITLCEKLFLLNKKLFGIDVFYEINLPNIFLFVHPLGTVIGRGKFDDYLMIYQGCGIGANHNVYPTLGKHVTLHPNVSILGECNIGENCEFAANSTIIDKNLESNTIYFGNPKKNFKKKNLTIHNIWKYEK